MKQEITYEDYNKVEIKVGTILKVSKNEKDSDEIKDNESSHNDTNVTLCM